MFYTAFKTRTLRAMAACYHADVEFSDPVFPALEGEPRPRAMWAMLTRRKADPNDRSFDNVRRMGIEGGGADWEAECKKSFPPTDDPSTIALTPTSSSRTAR